MFAHIVALIFVVIYIPVKAFCDEHQIIYIIIFHLLDYVIMYSETINV